MKEQPVKIIIKNEQVEKLWKMKCKNRIIKSGLQESDIERIKKLKNSICEFGVLKLANKNVLLVKDSFLIKK